MDDATIEALAPAAQGFVDALGGVIAAAHTSFDDIPETKAMLAAFHAHCKPSW